ncbi:MAG: MarC family protein [Bacteroidales bacterium]|jgi:multiple antibiotic resistance protein|nr:MarC family protein [Bacteroidales bacterium]MDD3167150.1 MarC family protein [Bacteroidales bacterium]MDD4770307.1 MarC family protein [Bacteroidales bacterium]HKL92075.1 MarC family protein [Bacteroidales bacterium]
MSIDPKEILSAFMVLFAIIDITGSIPIIVDIKQRKGNIYPEKVSIVSLLTLVAFLFAGEAILNLFGVDVSTFAVAGSFVIFVLATEMILDVRIFKDESPAEASFIVPLVFPLIAGAGAFTTLLSLRAEYAVVNILIALILNLMVVYAVLKSTHIIERILGKGGIYVLRKFFGIILLAISVKLFTSNLDPLLQGLSLSQDAAAILELLR